MDIPLSDLRNEIISTVLTQEIVDLPTTKKICGIASSIYYSWVENQVQLFCERHIVITIHSKCSSISLNAISILSLE